jgi:sugar diacid utilization regulator
VDPGEVEGKLHRQTEQAVGSRGGHSRQLYLSVRAVTYRLDRIKQLTGSDPAEPTQHFTLEAVVLRATSP